ncbi:MAG: type I-A CRISPR-associated protein Cas4/Csa1 [Candidatus Bathyarchaeaceae archaeon]
MNLFQRIQTSKIEVSEELRGWRYSDYPLRPPSSSKISVGDLSLEFCPTGRLFFLRYVQKRHEGKAFLLSRGKYIHSVFGTATMTVKSILLNKAVRDGSSFLSIFQEEGERIKPAILKEFDLFSRSEEEERFEKIFNKIWGMAANTYSYQLDKAITRSPYLSLDGLVSSVVPVLTEFPLDGTLLGFQKSIRVDALLLPSLIIELKTRDIKQEHKIGLAAYSMVFESLFNIPVDYALILNLKINRDATDIKVYEELVAISDSLRMATIERRDGALKIIDDGIDPGKPDRCNTECPYYETCNQ